VRVLTIGVLSDIHLVRKTDRLRSALRALKGAELLLMAGDLADRGLEEQYGLIHDCVREELGDIPVYCVFGNHDVPARDDTAFRAFEQLFAPQAERQAGAFHRLLSEDADLTGLNPVYHQKQFFFPDRGAQLEFLREKLAASPAKVHIVLCHPPLLAHNPQRAADGSPYIVREQNDRLQQIVDENRGIVFIAGHTHLFPTVEREGDNLYLNDGSICPTTDPDGNVRQGNVTLMTIGREGISLTVRGIHTGIEFCGGEFAL